MTAHPRIDLYSGPRNRGNFLILFYLTADPCDKVVRLPVVLLICFCFAAPQNESPWRTIDIPSLSSTLATGTTRSLFDNGVSRKLVGFIGDRMPLTNYLTGRGLDGRDKQFMRGHSARTDGPSVRRRRPLSPCV